MPDFAMHHLFGTQLDVPVAAKEHPALFNWGLQGPDLFFYRKVLLGSPYHALGNRMHNLFTDKLFSALSAYCRQLDGEHRTLAQAYVYGFAGHYALDSTAHPYVFAQQRLRTLGQPEQAQGVAHVAIETDMDADIYTYMRGGNVCRFNLAEHYTLNETERRAVGSLYSHLLYEVYQVLISSQEVIASLQDTFAMQRLVFSGARPLVAAASLLDRFRGNRLFTSHLKGVQPAWDSLNLDGAAWNDPWTGEERHESVPDLMEQAAGRFYKLTGILARNSAGAVLRVPVDTDFSGKALTAPGVCAAAT